MATYCNKCGGTGHAANNKFCTCVDGKLLRQMADAREKEIQARAEREKKEAVEKARKKMRDVKQSVDKILNANEIDLEKMVEDNLKEFGFYLGQWVIANGIVGTITNIDGASRKVKVIGHHFYDDGRPYTGTNGWIDFGKVAYAPLEQFDDVSLPMLFVQLEHELNINYALDTGNKELFMELTESD